MSCSENISVQIFWTSEPWGWWTLSLSSDSYFTSYSRQDLRNDNMIKLISPMGESFVEFISIASAQTCHMFAVRYVFNVKYYFIASKNETNEKGNSTHDISYTNKTTDTIWCSINVQFQRLKWIVSDVSISRLKIKNWLRIDICDLKRLISVN